jgi:hypothetical protein
LRRPTTGRTARAVIGKYTSHDVDSRTNAAEDHDAALEEIYLK